MGTEAEDNTDEEAAARSKICSGNSSIDLPLILRTEGRHARVLLVLLVFKTIDVLEMDDVTFCVVVTVGPAGIVI